MENGITLILTEPLSEKAKEKLRKLSENQKKHLEQMKKDFEEGKYDSILQTLIYDLEKCEKCRSFDTENCHSINCPKR